MKLTGDPNCLHIPGLTLHKGSTYALVVSDKDDLDAVLPANVVHSLKVRRSPFQYVWRDVPAQGQHLQSWTRTRTRDVALDLTAVLTSTMMHLMKAHIPSFFQHVRA